LEQKDIVGSWKLASFELRANDGDVTFPFGKRAQGYLLYTPEGYMSAVLMAEERPRFAAADLILAAPEEQARAAATYLSYSGPYELRGGRVVHHVEVSLFPNWIGLSQERIVQWIGDKLSLSTPEMALAGKTQRGYLIWERAPVASVQPAARS